MPCRRPLLVRLSLTLLGVLAIPADGYADQTADEKTILTVSRCLYTSVLPIHYKAVYDAMYRDQQPDDVVDEHGVALWQKSFSDAWGDALSAGGHIAKAQVAWYEENFTHSEILELSEFCRSETGQKFWSLRTKMQKTMGAATETWYGETWDDLAEQFGYPVLIFEKN